VLWARLGASTPDIICCYGQDFGQGGMPDIKSICLGQDLGQAGMLGQNLLWAAAPYIMERGPSALVDLLQERMLVCCDCKSW